MTSKLLQGMKDLLNEGYSIFGDLDESVRRLEDFKEEIKGEPENGFILDAFEVHGRTKNHETPYITMSLEGELISGYSTVLGNKLIKIAKKFGESENNHYFMRDTGGLGVTFGVGVSPSGEYIDIKAV